MNLTLGQVAKFSGGELSLGSDPDLLLTDVVIDSRKVEDGVVFVALPGEKCDGHDFVVAALRKFKAVALVNRSYQLEPLPNLVYVDDTILALGKLASNYRNLFDLKIVGITGSNGKTSTKEMLNSIAVSEFGVEHVLATQGNLNNHLGVPLTLLQLKKEHKVAIIEMGMNHAGELDYLTKLVKPSMALVTNVMLAHAGFFNDLTDIAHAKAEIFHGLMPGGIACINMEHKFHNLFATQVPKSAQIQNFGISSSGLYIKSIDVLGNLVIVTPIGEMVTKLQILGTHNAQNALMATALALNLGCSLKSISVGLHNYTGYKHRLERKVAFNGALIIDDSYNANLDSVKAAILAIKYLPKPHWLVFADLGELGKFSGDVHKSVGEFAQENGIDHLITLGEASYITYGIFNGAKLHAKTKSDIVEYCLTNLPKTATLLIKGSNNWALWTIADTLTGKT